MRTFLKYLDLEKGRIRSKKPTFKGPYINFSYSVKDREWEPEFKVIFSSEKKSWAVFKKYPYNADWVIYRVYPIPNDLWPDVLTYQVLQKLTI